MNTRNQNQPQMWHEPVPAEAHLELWPLRVAVREGIIDVEDRVPKVSDVEGDGRAVRGAQSQQVVLWRNGTEHCIQFD